MTEDRKRANRPPSDRAAPAGSDERRARAGTADANTSPATLEDALLALAAARRELASLRSDRDRLFRELTVLGGMQTETIALGTDETSSESPGTLPTLDDLMAGLNGFEEAAAERVPDVELESGVMLAPELVFGAADDAGEPRTRPASYEAAPARSRAATGNGAAREPEPVRSTASAERTARPRRATNSKLLVFVDADPPIKYPLYKPVMTVGRSETADIRVDGDYISRVHARITTVEDGAVTVEDVASKNGIRVNGREVKSHRLRHGDVLSLGKLHFTFIDTSAAD